MGSVAVEASGLGFTWPSGRRGVVGVDLTVASGERVVVMGPNGSGKSTLVRLLTGELRPGSGSLRVLGAPPADADAELRRRAGVAGDRAVHLDALTGRENALLFARAHGLEAGAAAERTTGLLRRFDLDEVADVPVDEYSLGMRRKLLLVEALIHDPELLLLDEPTLGLDPPALEALAGLVRAAAGRGAASVVATNDVSAAPGLADRIVFLHEGRVVADAAAADLLADLEGGASVSVGVEAGGGGAVLRDAVAAVSGEMPVADARIGDDGVWLRLPRGSADAPGLLEALVRRGVAVRRLDIREPDLGDVFRRLTGRGLTDGAGPPPPRGRA